MKGYAESDRPVLQDLLRPVRTAGPRTMKIAIVSDDEQTISKHLDLKPTVTDIPDHLPYGKTELSKILKDLP
jgi:hypothetical protein